MKESLSPPFRDFKAVRETPFGLVLNLQHSLEERYQKELHIQMNQITEDSERMPYLSVTVPLVFVLSTEIFIWIKMSVMVLPVPKSHKSYAPLPVLFLLF